MIFISENKFFSDLNYKSYIDEELFCLILNINNIEYEEHIVPVERMQIECKEFVYNKNKNININCVVLYDDIYDMIDCTIIKVKTYEDLLNIFKRTLELRAFL